MLLFKFVEPSLGSKVALLGFSIDAEEVKSVLDACVLFDEFEEPSLGSKTTVFGLSFDAVVSFDTIVVGLKANVGFIFAVVLYNNVLLFKFVEPS